MQTVKFLLIASLFSLIPSQLIRIEVSQTSAINVTDIFTALTIAVFTIVVAFSKKKVKIPTFIFPSGVLFILFVTASTILSLNNFAPREVMVGSLFLMRLTAYIMLSVVVVNTLKKNEVEKFINLTLLVGFIFAALGFLQLIFFADLRPLVKYGWDPHINRLVSTTLDPNYTGMLLIIFASLSISKLTFGGNRVYAFLYLFSSAAVLLTFSRSAYLAYFAVVFVVSLVKLPKLIILPPIIFLITYTFVPAVEDRISGAIALDETSLSRIESWKNAISIISDNPVFGVGFNNYRYAQEKYGFITYDTTGGHSGAGADSSLLFTTATTGIVGLLFYLIFIFSLFKNALKGIRTDYLSLSVVSIIAALLIHSMFVNSLYFPQILFLMMFLSGLKYARNI